MFFNKWDSIDLLTKKFTKRKCVTVMAFYAEQLPSGRWGIYSEQSEDKETRLMATVACQTTCATIMANLKSGRRDAPTSDLSQLYQVPELPGRLRAAAPPTTKSATKPGISSQRTTVSSRKTRRKSRTKSSSKSTLESNSGALTNPPSQKTILQKHKLTAASTPQKSSFIPSAERA